MKSESTTKLGPSSKIKVLKKIIKIKEFSAVNTTHDVISNSCVSFKSKKSKASTKNFVELNKDCDPLNRFYTTIPQTASSSLNNSFA